MPSLNSINVVFYNENHREHNFQKLQLLFLYVTFGTLLLLPTCNDWAISFANLFPCLHKLFGIFSTPIQLSFGLFGGTGA